MQKLCACILVATAAADRCSGAICDGNVPHGRSLLQKDAASSLKQDYSVVDDDRDIGAETDDKKRKSLTKSLDIDVKIMEREFTNMNEKMKVVEDTLGVTTTSSGKSDATEAKKEEASLQQTATEPSDSLLARMNLLETNIADLLSRTEAVETEVGVARVSLLDVAKDPVMGLANRAIAVHVRVHDLQKRIAKMELTVINGLKPDAMLLKKDVETLEGKVNALRVSVQGPAASLLGIGSSEEGLKSQVSDLETRVGELLSTTTTLETEVHGPPSSNKLVSEEALLQEEKSHGKHGLVPRVSVLKDKVSNLKSRVFTLEHHVAGLGLEQE